MINYLISNFPHLEYVLYLLPSRTSPATVEDENSTPSGMLAGLPSTSVVLILSSVVGEVPRYGNPRASSNIMASWIPVAVGPSSSVVVTMPWRSRMPWSGLGTG